MDQDDPSCLAREQDMTEPGRARFHPRTRRARGTLHSVGLWGTSVCVSAVLACTGCRQLFGLQDPVVPDAPADIAVDAAPFRITGTTVYVDMTGAHPLSAATVEWVSTGPVVMTTSDAAGAFTLEIPRPAPDAGWVHARHVNYRDSYVDGGSPIASDISALQILLMTPGTFTGFTTLASVTPIAGDGMILVAVLDAQGHVVAGASVSSSPGGVVRYNAAGIPSSSATSTDADGLAYIFNLPPGSVTVSAMAPGGILPSQTVTSHPDQLTEMSLQSLP
jgi:hypothetical protein